MAGSQLREMAGKRLTAKGIEVARVSPKAFAMVKSKINPLLIAKGITAGWTSGGAGSFDPLHDYSPQFGTLKTDSGDIDIMIDPRELEAKFPPNVPEWNASLAKPLGPKALANAQADPAKQAKLNLSASKAALADYLTSQGLPTDRGNLTVEYVNGAETYSIDLIVRPKESWPLHTHDFSLDPSMRGGDLWNEIYPMLAKISSDTKTIDAKTGEEKGNLQFSPDRGLVDRTTGQVVASGAEKDKIAKILLHPSATARDLSSLTGIKNALSKYAPDKLAAIEPLFPPLNTVQESLTFGSTQWMRSMLNRIK